MDTPNNGEVRILIVDDDPDLLYGAQRVLQQANYATATAATAEETQQILPVFRPDMLLLDRDLPDIDGVELCRQIKNTPGQAELFVVLISGTYTESDAQAEGLESGADGYLVRPITNRELTARVAAYVRILKLTRTLREDRRRLAESSAALQESEERFRATFEQAAVGIAHVDLDGRWLRVNRRLCEIVGYHREELLQRTFQDMTYPDDLTADLACVRQVLAGEIQTYSIEKRYFRKDGSLVWIQLTVSLLRDPSGAPKHFISVIEDIDERKRAEETRRAMSHMLDAAPSSITVHDFGGRFLYANRRTFEMHGYDEQEYMSLSLSELDVPASGALIAERMRLIAERGEALFEVEHFRKDRSLLPLQVHVKLVSWSGVQAMLSIATDISERKRAAAEQEKLQAQLSQAQKMESVGRLAGGVAHDFNNLLTAIIGYAEFSQDLLAPEHPVRAFIEEILNGARRSAAITRQLLAFARQQIIAPKILDINEAVGEMLGMVRRLIGEDIQLVWSPGRNVWPVRMDPAQIDQILANLCVNARDAIAGVGKVTVETDGVTLDAAYCAQHAGFVPGDYVVLAVSDDGCGMDRATLEHIFEPFFTTKGVGKGTGLGLATVYGIVRQNNGMINVCSEPGQGTTFRIYLPRAEREAAQAPADGARQALADGTETILLVEDDAAVRRMARIFLERQGYAVLDAEGPHQALRLADRHSGRIDLLITDVVMPEMNGRELAGMLQQQRPNLKCLYMSGYTADIIAHRGILDAGMDFIGKPFSRVEFVRKVREILDG